MCLAIYLQKMLLLIANSLAFLCFKVISLGTHVSHVLYESRVVINISNKKERSLVAFSHSDEQAI